MAPDDKNPPLVSPRSPSYERARAEQANPSPPGEAQVVAILNGLTALEVESARTSKAAAHAAKDRSLALTRRLLVYDRELRQGLWHEAVSFSGTPERDLRGTTAGLIGLGHIGARAATLLRALGMRTIAVTRQPSPSRGAEHGLDWLGGMGDLTRLLDQSTFAILCVPLTDETRGLIGKAELLALGPEGYLVNVCRGPVVEEHALFDALRSRTIAGAALDVTR